MLQKEHILFGLIVKSIGHFLCSSLKETAPNKVKLSGYKVANTSHIAPATGSSTHYMSSEVSAKRKTKIV